MATIFAIMQLPVPVCYLITIGFSHRSTVKKVAGPGVRYRYERNDEPCNGEHNDEDDLDSWDCCDSSASYFARSQRSRLYS
jgi:hypothetical protein